MSSHEAVFLFHTSRDIFSQAQLNWLRRSRFHTSLHRQEKADFLFSDIYHPATLLIYSLFFFPPRETAAVQPDWTTLLPGLADLLPVDQTFAQLLFLPVGHTGKPCRMSSPRVQPA